MCKVQRVRIAVAICADGSWSSCGWGNPNNSKVSDSEMRHFALEDTVDQSTTAFYWIEADVPIPTEKTIQGELLADETETMCEKRRQDQLILLSESQARLCVAIDALEPVSSSLMSVDQVQDLSVATKALQRILLNVNMLLDARNEATEPTT